MRALLQYDRLAIASGELWRLLTGQWVHWNLEHLVFSLGSFAVLGLLLARRDPRLLAWTVALSIAAVSATLWFAAPEVHTYRGLSGPATALFFSLTIHLGAELVRRRRWPALTLTGVLALGAFAKLAYEVHSGGFLFHHSGFVAVPIAHVAGAVTGLLTGVQSLLKASS